MNKEMSIQEGNAIIAGFMKESFVEFHGMICRCEPDGSPWDNDPISWLNYDINWNELMPVVEKIESCSLSYEIKRFSFQIENKFCLIQGHTGVCQPFCFYQTPYGSHPASKIEETWKAAVDFIQWYNSQKK